MFGAVGAAVSGVGCCGGIGCCRCVAGVVSVGDVGEVVYDDAVGVADGDAGVVVADAGGVVVALLLRPLVLVYGCG